MTTTTQNAHATNTARAATLSAQTVTLRRYPYPYRAMFALCSDLDETPDKTVYLQIARYLNTTAATAMGPGVGLEVGNSIFFFMPNNQFAYYTTDDAGRDMVHTLIHSGHIDCLHSYGDFAPTRREAQQAIEQLDKHHCKLAVWVDHSRSASNFGPDIMAGRGDIPGDVAYHADLTVQYGIRYVWRGRTTGITGQNAPITAAALAHLFHPSHPLASAKTLLKETAKIALGKLKRPRWQMHAANAAYRPGVLRDGQRIWEFMRCDPFWGGQSHADHADGLAAVLTTRTLDALVRRGAVCLLYTHLGKTPNPQRPFSPATCSALELLRRYRDEGRIMVTTTYRLLQYLTVRDHLQYRVERIGQTLTITLEAVNDPLFGPRSPTPDEIQGVTFTAPRTDTIEIRLNDQPIRHNATHNGDTTYAAIPWRPLTFPL